MSRVANRIIDLPSGVTVSVGAGAVTVKGAKGTLSLPLGPGVSVQQQDKKLSVKYEGSEPGAHDAPARYARTWPTWSPA